MVCRSRRSVARASGSNCARAEELCNRAAAMAARERAVATVDGEAGTAACLSVNGGRMRLLLVAAISVLRRAGNCSARRHNVLIHEIMALVSRSPRFL